MEDWLTLGKRLAAEASKKSKKTESLENAEVGDRASSSSSKSPPPRTDSAIQQYRDRETKAITKLSRSPSRFDRMEKEQKKEKKKRKKEVELSDS
jgi:hypothetical protein